MFDLESSITNWRRQILAAGIKTSAVEELENHLREEIGRQIRTGLDEQKAFEISVSQMGRPEILGSEFKKSRGVLIKTIGIFAAMVGAVIISRILIEHPDAAHLREKEQTVWLVIGSIITFFGITVALIKVGNEPGMARVWKMVGIGYSIFASAFSILLTTLCLSEPRIHSAFTITDWTFIFAANAVSIFSIAGLRQGCRLLPVIQNLQIRMAIGVVCPLLGVAGMATYIVFIVPHQLQGWISHVVAMFLWTLAVMSLLGSIGYAIENAAHKSTAT